MGSHKQGADTARNPTPRQEEILRLVARGLSNKEIAKQLRVSPRTVQTHLGRLFLETGVHKRAAAVAAWLEGQKNDL